MSGWKVAIRAFFAASTAVQVLGELVFATIFAAIAIIMIIDKNSQSGLTWGSVFLAIIVVVYGLKIYFWRRGKRSRVGG